MTVVLAALAIMSTVGFALYSGTLSENHRLQLLARAAGAHRLARARLTGGFAYAKCDADTAGSRLVRGLLCRTRPPAEWSTAADLSAFATRTLRGSDSASHGERHALAIWDLLWARRDRAAAALRAVAHAEPGNARALNDLAVTLMAMAETADDPQLLVEAFTAADSAVRLQPTLPEASFTLAVSLESLYLRTDAIATWQRYLELDDSSPWAAEARKHLEDLRRPSGRWRDEIVVLRRAVVARDTLAIRALVMAYPPRARSVVQLSLGEWGAAWLAGDAKRADSLLAFARAVALPLPSATGDPMWFVATSVIDSVLARREMSRLLTLARGHAALAAGIAAFDSLDLPAATERLTSAERSLGAGQSPMVAWAREYLAQVATLSNHPDEALSGLAALRRAAPGEYVTLRSFSARSAGFIYDVRSDYVHGMAAYDSAVAEGSRTREPEITLRAAAWLASLTTMLRGREAGWRVLYAALAATPEYAEQSRPLQSVLGLAASSTEEDAPRLSLRYGDEVIRTARSSAAAAQIAVAYTRHSAQLARLGDTRLARQSVESAFAAARRVRDERARNMLIADATLARGVISLRESPSDATGALQEVVDEYRSSNYGRGLPSAYVLLAQAQVGARHFDAANAAFDSAMSVMERQRASLLDRDQRTEFLDNARDVIDRIIRFHADRGDARGAFDFFERTRSRVLLERLTTSAGSTAAAAPRFATASDVMARLGAQDVVLGYAVLRDELLVWRLSRAGIDLHRVPVSASELALRVGALRSSMIDPTAASNFAKASEQLYRLLVAPLGALAAEARLTIIPDRSLHFVPFAALRDRSGRFLVQDHEIAYAPSATLATRLGRTTSSVSGHTTRILAIANPSFDTSAFPLPPLPGAEREARAIASLYRRVSVLVGSRATDTELATIAPTFDIVHFAGHALVRPDAPGLSHLVLASDGRSDGAIFAGEIASWNLRRTELVVLSGCSTSDGRLSATEGASSLARAFFAAGVRSVIASLWAIEDAPTADFFAAFHRRLARGEGAGAALRATQIEWLGDASPRSPAVWAAFQLFTQ